MLTMTQCETTLVRRLIEKHEPIGDLELNFRLVEKGVEPHDAIVIQDTLKKQGRITYNPQSHCFSTPCESESRLDSRSNLP